MTRASWCVVVALCACTVAEDENAAARSLDLEPDVGSSVVLEPHGG